MNASDDSETEDEDSADDQPDKLESDNDDTEEALKDEMDYNEAVEKLTKIQQESKNINDTEMITEKRESLKRPAAALAEAMRATSNYHLTDALHSVPQSLSSSWCRHWPKIVLHV